MVGDSPDIPPIIWPRKDDDYKFVLVEVGGSDYLRFESFFNEYHGWILGRILKDLGVDFKTSGPDEFPIEDSDDYCITGIGKMELSLQCKRGIITDKYSAKYCSKSDEETLDRLRKLATNWSFEFD